MSETREEIELTWGGKPFKVSVVVSASKAFGRRVYLSGKDTRANHLAMDADSAYRLAVMLFGLSENHAEPVIEDPDQTKKIENGDLVMIPGVRGQYRGGTCLVWDYEVAPRPRHRFIAHRPGGGLHQHPEREMTVIEAANGRWLYSGAPVD